MKKVLNWIFTIIVVIGIGVGIFVLTQEEPRFSSQFKKKFSSNFDTQTHYFKNLKYLQGEWIVSPTAHYKPVFVFRFEAWNPGSLQALAFLNVMQKKYEREIQFLGITTEESVGLKEIIDSRIQIPVALDPQQQVDLFFGIKVLPFFCLISPEGTVFYEGTRVDETLLQEALQLVRREKYRN